MMAIKNFTNPMCTYLEYSSRTHTRICDGFVYEYSLYNITARSVWIDGYTVNNVQTAFEGSIPANTDSITCTYGVTCDYMLQYYAGKPVTVIPMTLTPVGLANVARKKIPLVFDLSPFATGYLATITAGGKKEIGLAPYGNILPVGMVERKWACPPGYRIGQQETSYSTTNGISYYKTLPSGLTGYGTFCQLCPMNTFSVGDVFSCTSCPPGTYNNGTGANMCLPCNDGLGMQTEICQAYFANSKEPEDLQLKDQVVPVSIVVSTACGLYLITLVVFRKTKNLKSLSPFFSSLVVLGCIGSSISTSIISIAGFSQNSCRGFLWLFVLSFSTVAASASVKNYRIWKIFNSRRRLKLISNGILILYVFALVGVNLILLAAWTAIDGPTRQSFIGSQSRFYYCGSSSPAIQGLFTAALIVYNGLLLVCAALFGFLSRTARNEFSEVQSMSAAVYNIFICGLISIAAGFVESFSINLRYGIVFACINFGAFMTPTILYGHKLFNTFRSNVTIELSTTRQSGLKSMDDQSIRAGATVLRTSKSTVMFECSVIFPGFLQAWKTAYIQKIQSGDCDAIGIFCEIEGGKGSVIIRLNGKWKILNGDNPTDAADFIVVIGNTIRPDEKYSVQFVGSSDYEKVTTWLKSGASSVPAGGSLASYDK